ncbi:MAG: hypothetical protein ACE5I7_13505 [Candidatus Binatia bacterium]
MTRSWGTDVEPPCWIALDWALLLLLVSMTLGCPYVANGNLSRERDSREGGQQAQSHSPEAAPYTPGLGEIMSLTQMRHLKLWFAADARNWALAAYELAELEEGFADAMRFHPTHKDTPRPLTELVPEFTDVPIRELRAAIENRDSSAFAIAYDALAAGCNGCHHAAHASFNMVVRPAANPYANQRFGAFP